MIRAILFDYAGVITPTRDNYLFAEKYSERFGLNPSELMRISYEGWNQVSVGDIPCDEFWGSIARKLMISPDKLKSLIFDTFPMDVRMILLINKLHAKYITVLISNQVEDWLERVIDGNNLRASFDYFVNSYQVKANKPDTKIFLEALRVSNVLPQEVLFIDDSAENIEVAKNLRMNVIQMNSFEGLLEELKEYVKLS